MTIQMMCDSTAASGGKVAQVPRCCVPGGDGGRAAQGDLPQLRFYEDNIVMCYFCNYN